MRSCLTVAILFSGLLAFQGCLVDKGELTDFACGGFCDTLQVTYDDTMKVLIDANCAISGCHVSGFQYGDFTSYASMQASGVLNPGKLEGRIFSLDNNFVMPQFNPMPDSVKAIFQCWICSGFPQQ